jgi:hypothetical protein
MDHHTQTTIAAPEPAPANSYNPDTVHDDDPAPVIPLDDASRLLSEWERHLRAARADWERAQQDFDRAVTDNPLAQGNAVIRRELEAEHLPALTTAERKALAVADAMYANARGLTDQTARTQFDLSPDDYRAMADRRELVRETCEDAPLSRLVAETQYAIQKQDRAGMALYARYLPRRLSDTSPGDGSGRDVAQLRTMLKTIDDALRDRTLAPIHDRAKALLGEATRLQGAATKREMASRTYGFQSDGEIKW